MQLCLDVMDVFMSPQAAVYNAVAKEIVGDVCRGFDGGAVLRSGKCSHPFVIGIRC
jgi:hypothetical protein